uniref:Uncharacterized protein n=1 Tax=Siphoviridae sp. ct6rT12 TaxID=2825346 RepID=A0A8S5V9I5_9CAUD|nr:MAG TPA: hypothetical protein [Siphoviridae sp. ct6rT12]
MVIKKMETRDYLRKLITRANKEAGVTYNAGKLNSKEECEKYLLNLIKDLKNAPKDNNAYIKEINELKEEIEIINKKTAIVTKVNIELNDKLKKLESERIFYITQAKEAGEKREKAEKDEEYFKNLAKYWNNEYHIKDAKSDFLFNINFVLFFIAGIEAISIVILLLTGYNYGL